MTDREIVQAYFDSGFRPVFWPAVGDAKGPHEPGWPTKIYTLADYHDGDRVGLLTGNEIAPGRFFHDVDLDWAPGNAIAQTLLPASGFTYGRQSKRVSHSGFTLPHALPSYRYEDIDNTCLIELRGTKKDGTVGGMQSMAPPSVWSKDGKQEKLAFIKTEAPAHFDDVTKVTRPVCYSAIGMILAKNLGVNRFGHEARLGFAGFLLRLDIPAEDVIAIGRAISPYTNNQEVDDVRSTVESTVAGLRDDAKKVKGGPALAKLIGANGKAVIARVREWIDRFAQTSEAPAVDGPPRVYERCTLDHAHTVVRRWFGNEYDMAAFDAMAATIAAERLDGDPVWLLLITGPGGAKTETLSSASGAGAIITSTIASEGALLSGSGKRDRTKDATGGLLRKIGERGVVVIKDVTTILTMNREARGQVLSALREIYDGRWERNLGSDGGKTLTWTGRIVVIGAVTTAWDTHHAVTASMGDRFVVVRIDSTSTTTRVDAGTHALDNTGSEVTMRAALAEVVGGVMAGVNVSPAAVTEEERKRLLHAANLVTLCRTSVEYDQQGKVIDAHAPEMPTRFAKQLMQIVRGARAIGMTVEQSMELAIRCARDSVPPLRLAILEAVEALVMARITDVRQTIEKPWTTVDRQLQSLHQLGVLICVQTDEEVASTKEGEAAKVKHVWTYELAEGIDPNVLRRPLDELACESTYGVSHVVSRVVEEPF